MSNHTTCREITWGKTESWESVLLKHCAREKQNHHIKDESGITRLEVIFKVCVVDCVDIIQKCRLLIPVTVKKIPRELWGQE